MNNENIGEKSNYGRFASKKGLKLSKSVEGFLDDFVVLELVHKSYKWKL